MSWGWGCTENHCYGVPATGSEGKAGASSAIPGSSGLGVGDGVDLAWAWLVQVVVVMAESGAQLLSWDNSSQDTVVCAGLLSEGR